VLGLFLLWNIRGEHVPKCTMITWKLSLISGLLLNGSNTCEDEPWVNVFRLTVFIGTTENRRR